VTGWIWGVLSCIGALLLLAAGDTVSEELRGWLDLAPRAVLQLAATRLYPNQRKTIYEDVWLPELLYALRGKEARPISRLIIGMRFAIGILVYSGRIGRYVYNSSMRQEAASVENDPGLAAALSLVRRELAPLYPASGPEEVQPAVAQPRSYPSAYDLPIAFRRHPAVLFRPVAFIVGMLSIVCIVSLAVNGLNGVFLEFIWIIWGLLFIRTLWKVVTWRVGYFLITADRLMLTSGILRRQVAVMPLANITDIILNRPILGRVLGYGEFRVKLPGNDSPRLLDHVPYPEEVFRELSGLIASSRKLG
jgi:hypothetical protein